MDAGHVKSGRQKNKKEEKQDFSKEVEASLFLVKIRHLHQGKFQIKYTVAKEELWKRKEGKKLEGSGYRTQRLRKIYHRGMDCQKEKTSASSSG